MTREEAAQLLWRVAYDKYGLDDDPTRQREAADIVVTALRGPEPDPDTGLVRCGCGGKADLYTHAGIDGVYSIKCEKCRVMIPYAVDMDKAINEWNTAMGCR